MRVWLDPPRGWRDCTGRTVTLASRYPGKRRRWWRCTVCRHVGWWTNTDQPPRIGAHLRPE